MLFRIVFAAFVTAASMIFAVQVNAASEPIFAKPGDWVVEADLEAVLEQSSGSEAILVVLDQQMKLQSGQVSSYRDVVVRIDSTKTMTSMLSLFTPSWHPDHGDLIIHRYEIIRDGEIIDLTQMEGLFEIIRREKNFERQMINGNLTAISQVGDVQLNDLVRMSLTTTVKNEALDGRVQASGRFITEDLNVDFVRQTVTWPDDLDVDWRASKDEIGATQSSANGWNVLTFDHRSKDPDVEIPKNAPIRFRQTEYFEIASFGSWEEVSKVSAKLYASKDGVVPGGDLDSAIQGIAEKTSNKRERMGLALQLVQERVRYLFNGLGFGNYAPQSPEETWRLRYGDCKAKTYLLLAALRRLGIKSEPMLVNTSQRDAVADRLPSFQAFNHILVKAELDGEVYWLDGTTNRTALADMADSPTHRFGLPSRAKGADLEAIPIRRPGRPLQHAEVSYDLSAGTDLPALFSLKLTFRDKDATELKDAASQFSAETAREYREEVAAKYVLDGVVTDSEYTYDDETQTGFLTAQGVAYLSWERKAGRRRHEIWSQAKAINVEESRSEKELRDLPVILGSPYYFVYDVTYILPERYADADLDGELSVDDEYAGFKLSRSISRDGNTIVSRERRYTNQWELEAKDFEPERRRLALLNRKNVKIVLPASSPEPWQDIETLKGTETLQRIRAAFGRNVEAASDEKDEALGSRAGFFQTIGDYELAAADLKRSLEIEADSGRFARLGGLLTGSDPDAAKANYRSAIEINPTYFDALLMLVRLHLSQGEFDQANAVVEEAKKAGLRESSADSLQIEILQAQGKYDNALKIMNALVGEEPDNALFLADRCLLRALEAKELDLAIEDCTNMIEIAERSSYYHFLRGFAYYRQGKLDEAVVDLNKAIKEDEYDSLNYYLRSIVYDKMGKTKEAADDLKAARYFYQHYDWYWSRFFK